MLARLCTFARHSSECVSLCRNLHSQIDSEYIPSGQRNLRMSDEDWYVSIGNF